MVSTAILDALLLLTITTNANFYPIEVMFGANKQQHVALNAQSTLAARYEQTHLQSERSDTASQTRSDFPVLARLDSVSAKSHEVCDYAQAKCSA
jgi:hypothetical protein